METIVNRDWLCGDYCKQGLVVWRLVNRDWLCGDYCKQGLVVWRLL